MTPLRVFRALAMRVKGVDPVEWIGVVYNDVREPTDEGWGAVVSEVVLDETLTDGLDGIEEFSHVLILYWMHRAAEAEPVRMRRAAGARRRARGRHLRPASAPPTESHRRDHGEAAPS
jgi:hypothetical protein